MPQQQQSSLPIQNIQPNFPAKIATLAAASKSRLSSGWIIGICRLSTARGSPWARMKQAADSEMKQRPEKQPWILLYFVKSREAEPRRIPQTQNQKCKIKNHLRRRRDTKAASASKLSVTVLGSGTARCSPHRSDSVISKISKFPR